MGPFLSGASSTKPEVSQSDSNTTLDSVSGREETRRPFPLPSPQQQHDIGVHMQQTSAQAASNVKALLYKLTDIFKLQDPAASACDCILEVAEKASSQRKHYPRKDCSGRRAVPSFVLNPYSFEAAGVLQGVYMRPICKLRPPRHNHSTNSYLATCKRLISSLNPERRKQRRDSAQCCRLQEA